MSGKAVSQEEEPFSLARFTDLRRLSDRRMVRSWASFELFLLGLLSNSGLGFQLLGNNVIPVVLILGYDVIIEGGGDQKG